VRSIQPSLIAGSALLMRETLEQHGAKTALEGARGSPG